MGCKQIPARLITLAGPWRSPWAARGPLACLAPSPQLHGLSLQRVCKAEPSVSPRNALSPLLWGHERDRPALGRSRGTRAVCTLLSLRQGTAPPSRPHEAPRPSGPVGLSSRSRTGLLGPGPTRLAEMSPGEANMAEGRGTAGPTAFPWPSPLSSVKPGRK